MPRLSKKEKRVLSPDKQELLIEELKKEDYCRMYIAALYTGLRRGEFLDLTWDDVALVSGTIKVTKTLSRIKTYKETEKTRLFVSEPKTDTSKRIISVVDSLIPVLKK